MMVRNFILLLSVTVLFGGCSGKKEERPRIVVARAGEKTLYYDQIPRLVHQGMEKTDSIAVIRSYIHRWARKELMCIKAEHALRSDYKAEVDRQIREMHDNLIIYQYQQQVMLNKVDTAVSENEMQEFFVSNMSTFTLTNNIIKALFIKIPVTAPDTEKARKWFKAADNESMIQLKNYCYQHAVQYIDFNDEWIPFNQLLMLVPLEIDNQESWLSSNDNAELKDSNYYYLISIRDYVLRNDSAPYDYIKGQIKTIIINNRRNDFLKKLEDGIYNEAVRKNELKIY